MAESGLRRNRVVSVPAGASEGAAYWRLAPRSQKARNSAYRWRSAVIPYTFPVRVSKPANRFRAPLRSFSCSTRTGAPAASLASGTCEGAAAGWSSYRRTGPSRAPPAAGCPGRRPLGPGRRKPHPAPPGATARVVPPRLEPVVVQDPADRVRRDGLDDALGHQLARPFLAVPLGQGTALIIRSLARHLDQVQRDLGEKRPAVGRCVVGREARRGHAPQSGDPIGGHSWGPTWPKHPAAVG